MISVEVTETKNSSRKNSLETHLSPRTNDPLVFPSTQASPVKTSTPIPNKKASYDEDDVENYFEDKQTVCNGSEANPEFTNCHVLHKVKEKSLKTDLKAAGFSAEIVMKADEIFLQMKSGLKRGVRRRQLMFFCVQSAYNELRIPEDPNRLALLCGITSSEISKAYSMCSPAKVGYKPPAVFWKPEDYLKMYFQKIVDMDIIAFDKNVLEDLKKICSEVMTNDPQLNEEKPQICASAILTFYLQLQGYTLDKKKYVEIFNKSDMSILKVKAKIAAAYNS